MSIITPESKIEELRLSEHAAACLEKAGAVFVCDLLNRAGAELRLSCDQPAFDEIERRLAEAGLEIGGGLE